MALVDLEEGDNSLGSLLSLDLLGSEADCARSLGGVVEVSQAKGIVSELLSVELHQLGVPLLGELPNYFTGDLHFYIQTNTYQSPLIPSIFIRLSLLTST